MVGALTVILNLTESLGLFEEEEEEKQTAQEFTQQLEAQFGNVEPYPERHGEAIHYDALVDAVAGEADRQSELVASEQEFIAKVDPDFG